MAYHLTEENIKHATLSFLKSYYKNNSSRGFGDTEATLDMQTGNGIIADGYLKFSVDEDPLTELSAKEAEKKMLNGETVNAKKKATFLATFEATSQQTAAEIQYRIQKTLLIFDALAIASMVAAGSYGYNYMNEQFTLNQLGTFKFFAGFFAVMIASMIGYILIFRKLSRYHYIYALAQFKRYHADEQWVSYGEDVFANPDNKYFLELRKQCIREGFGLIVVNKDLQPNLVMTPVRPNGNKKKGTVRQFFADQTKKKAFKWVNGIKVPTLKSPINTQDYKRFTQSYWKQGLVVLAMLFVIGEIYLEELKNPNIIFADETAYQKELAEVAQKASPEPTDQTAFESYIEEDIRFQNGTNTSEEPTPKLKSQPKQPRKKVVTTPTAPSVAKVSPTAKNKKDALIIATGMEEFVSYDCSRLSALTGNHFLVQIATANSSTEAIRKVKQFNESGFKANAVWLGCFTNKRNYVVYLDDIFNQKDAAVNRMNRYNKLMIAKGKTQDSVIRMISGK
ncbi:MAG: hypothetical protein AAF960_11575 [Bacteroidota bacterium]